MPIWIWPSCRCERFNGKTCEAFVFGLFGPLLHSSPPKLHSPFPLKVKMCLFKWEHASPRLLGSFYSRGTNRIHCSPLSYMYLLSFSLVSLHKYVCIFSSIRPTLYKGHKPSCLASSRSRNTKTNSELSCSPTSPEIPSSISWEGALSSGVLGPFNSIGWWLISVS